jgi:hypothetical protein
VRHSAKKLCELAPIEATANPKVGKFDRSISIAVPKILLHSELVLLFQITLVCLILSLVEDLHDTSFCAQFAFTETEQLSQKTVIGVTNNFLTRAQRCYKRHVKLLVLAAIVH